MSIIVGGGIVGSGFIPKQGTYNLSDSGLSTNPTFNMQTYSILQNGGFPNNRQWSDVVTLSGQYLIENLSVGDGFVSLRILSAIDDSVLYEFINDVVNLTTNPAGIFGDVGTSRSGQSSVLLSDIKIQVSRLSSSGLSRVLLKAWEL